MVQCAGGDKLLGTHHGRPRFCRPCRLHRQPVRALVRPLGLISIIPGHVINWRKTIKKLDIFKMYGSHTSSSDCSHSSDRIPLRLLQWTVMLDRIHARYTTLGLEFSTSRFNQFSSFLSSFDECVIILATSLMFLLYSHSLFALFNFRCLTTLYFSATWYSFAVALIIAQGSRQHPSYNERYDHSACVGTCDLRAVKTIPCCNTSRQCTPNTKSIVCFFC